MVMKVMENGNPYSRIDGRLAARRAVARKEESPPAYINPANVVLNRVSRKRRIETAHSLRVGLVSIVTASDTAVGTDHDSVG